MALSSPDNQNLAFTYDGSLPTAQTMTGEVQGSSSLTFNNDFQLTQATAAGQAVNYTYDPDGLRTAAGALSLTSDPQNGLLKTLVLGSTTTQIAHNPYGEPVSLDTDHSGSNLFELNLTRDDAGRITTKQEIRPSATTTWAYNYDAAGRLENVIKDGAQYANYFYDANSNRTAKTVEGSTDYATFDARDRMRTQGDLDLTFNDNGELVSKRNRVTGDELTLAYTTLGDLKSATTPGGDQIEYLLDGLGHRVGKKLAGQLTQGLIYSPEAYGPVAELDENSDLVARFIYGRASNVPDYMEKGSNTYRLITDQLGSVVMVVDAQSGAVAQEIAYGPFGEVLSDSNPGFQPFGFAGGIYDQDTGLTHFGAREYDAELGRWTAADPIGFGGGDSNLYGYVLGDPVNLVDPDGLIPIPGTDAIENMGRAIKDPVDAAFRTARDAVESAYNGVTRTAAEIQRLAAEITIDPDASAAEKAVAWVVGPLASLLTCENIDDTALTVAGGGGAGAAARAAGRPGAKFVATVAAVAVKDRAKTEFRRQLVKHHKKLDDFEKYKNYYDAIAPYAKEIARRLTKQ